MLKTRLCSMLILLSLSCTPVAYAQIRSATITGTVVDPQKAIVPGATVVITNESTNVSVEFVTTDAGLFTAPALQAGTYTVTVTLTGFAPFKRTGIVVGTTETVRVPVELTVSQLGETVEVSAEAPLLQTDKTSVSNAVGAELIEALPNITQNPLAYAALAGGLPRVAVADTSTINGSYNGGLGGTVTNPTAAQAALGLRAGMGNSNSFGTRGMGTYNPRQIMLRATYRF